MLDHPPFLAIHQGPLVKAVQAGGQLVFHHALPGVVGEAPLHLAAGIAYLGQVADGVVTIADEHFSALIGVHALDAGYVERVADQFDLHQVEGVAQPHQASGLVIIKVDAVVVAVTQLAQAQSRRVCRGGFEQAIHTIVAFNQ